MWQAVQKFLCARLPLWLRPRYILELRSRAAQWRAVRAEHLKKEPSCVACGRQTDLSVHHIIPVSVNPNRELDPDNLITLCENRCHIVFGHFMSYHCYNPEVRRMAEEYYRKLKKRSCHKSL